MKIWYKMIFWKGWNCELRQRGGKEKQTKGKVLRYFAIELD